MVQSRPRLFFSVVCGVAVYIFLPQNLRLITRELIGWNAGVWLYFALVAILIARASRESMRRRAALLDDGRFAILILTSLAAAAAFGGIFAQLVVVRETTGVTRALHVCLTALTVVSAWAFIHVMFALHYAHEYFSERVAKTMQTADSHAALRFPGTSDPDYLDFLYFSFVIGVACATADIEIWAPGMRRTALVHCVLAFFFNTAVLALTINIAAGLV
ncbi:MAG: DUF1345 domain-containing protein [Methylovirgula sp.]